MKLRHIIPGFVAVVCLAVSAQAQLDLRIQYSTYLSGSKTFCHDQFGNSCFSSTTLTPPIATPVAVALDGTGNMYVAGLTNEIDFPTTRGPTIPVFCATDGSACKPAASFLAKFSPQGRLIYSTLLPSGYAVYGMAVDSSGNAYVIGDTNLEQSSFRQFFAFVIKFSSTGAVLYTYIPDLTCSGDQQDTALAIALNATGTQASLAGISNDTGIGCIKTTPGSYKPVAAGGIWAIKLDVSQASTASLIYGTYLGPDRAGSPGEIGLGGIGADSQGNAYLTGWVSNQFVWPTTSAAYRTTAQGGTFDTFVTKLNSTGSALIYSTYLGGSGDDVGFAIRVDSVGDAFVAGTTTSTNFPHTSSFGSGSSTSFVTRLNSAGNGLIYSALLHGASASGIEQQTTAADGGVFATGQVRGGSNGVIALDSSGHAYTTGFTNTTGFPTTNPFQSFLKGTSDAFFTNLSTTGSSLITSSFLGGSSTEAIQTAGRFVGPTLSTAAISVDKAWNSLLAVD